MMVVIVIDEGKVVIEALLAEVALKVGAVAGTGKNPAHLHTPHGVPLLPQT